MHQNTAIKFNTTEGKFSGIFGWAGFDTPLEEGLPAEDILFQMGRSIGKFQPANTVMSGASAIGTIAGHTCKSDYNVLATILGNPYWDSNELWKSHHEFGPAHALVEAYKAKGPDCTQHISGSFALALIDPENRVAVLAVDNFSRFPLYYGFKNNRLIFGSSARSLLEYPGITPSISHQGIYNYIYFHMIPSPTSIYKNLSKLQSGTRLLFSPDNVSIDRYSKPTFDENSPLSFVQLKNELRHTLTKSVKRCIEGADERKVGSFLSGGLDSSTVTGILSEVSEGSAQAFSIGFSAEGYDEMEYARNTAAHFGLKLHEYYVTPKDVTEALPFIATSYDEPFGNSSALPAWFCSRFAAEEGIELLLAGDGGDELFAGNERYARQKLFEYYHLIPESIRKSLISPVVQSLPSQIKFIQKAKSYIQQSSIPLPDRLQSYNYLHRHDPADIFTSDFLEQVNQEDPLRLLRDVYHTPTSASALNRMLFLDWQFTLADNDLRKVSHMCNTAGVKVEYPMLDHDLVSFSTRIPSNLKLKGQNLRHFYKRALTGWLPDETINKSKKGFGLPFGVWLSSYKPLQELADENLLNFRSKGIIKPAFLESLVELHRNQHAHYYGELIWVLVVLELWLSNKDSISV